MQKMTQAWLARLGYGLVLRLVATAVVIPVALICLVGPMALYSNGALGERWGPLVLVGGAVAFVVVILGGVFGVSAFILSRRAHRLDAAFNPLGLTGKPLLLASRQYAGQAQGREARAYFQRGPMVALYVSTPLQTRLSVGEKSRAGVAVGRFFNRAPFSAGAPALDPYVTYALDEVWARELWRDPEAQAACARLMQPSPKSWSYESRQVHLQPGAFYLQRLYVNEDSLTPEVTRQWLNDLLTLARAAERLPAPTQTAAASRLETWAFQSRGLSLGQLALIVFAMVIMPLCLIIPFVAVLIMLDQR
jgi:hypothetical protein